MINDKQMNSILNELLSSQSLHDDDLEIFIKKNVENSSVSEIEVFKHLLQEVLESFEFYVSLYYNKYRLNESNLELYQQRLHQTVLDLYPWIEEDTYKKMYGRYSYR